MKSKLFLTGISGCGKTTMIRNALAGSAAFAGGFVTYRVLNESGSLLGYDLAPAAFAAGVENAAPVRFLDYSITPPVKNDGAFRQNAIRLLKEAAEHPFAVLDEIGGFELLIPEFRDALADFLAGDTPCIGVWKGDPNSAVLRRRIGLPDGFMAERVRTEALIRANGTILETGGRYDKAAAEAVREWCDTYAASGQSFFRSRG